MVHQSNWYHTDKGYVVARKIKQICQREYMELIVPLTVIKVRFCKKDPWWSRLSFGGMAQAWKGWVTTLTTD